MQKLAQAQAQGAASVQPGSASQVRLQALQKAVHQLQSHFELEAAQLQAQANDGHITQEQLQQQVDHRKQLLLQQMNLMHQQLTIWQRQVPTQQANGLEHAQQPEAQAGQQQSQQQQQMEQIQAFKQLEVHSRTHIRTRRPTLSELSSLTRCLVVIRRDMLNSSNSFSSSFRPRHRVSPTSKSSS